MHELCELLRAQIARVGLLSAVQAQMRLQVGRAGEAFLADVALMWLLPGVHQMMLLQVRQLGEALRADVALERTLTRMRAQMHLKVAQLSEGFAAYIALVVHLAVLLLERIRQRAIATRCQRVGTEWTATAWTRIAIGTEAARRRDAQRREALQRREWLHQWMVEHLCAALQQMQIRSRSSTAAGIRLPIEGRV